MNQLFQRVASFGQLTDEASLQALTLELDEKLVAQKQISDAVTETFGSRTICDLVDGLFALSSCATEAGSLRRSWTFSALLDCFKSGQAIPAAYSLHVVNTVLVEMNSLPISLLVETCRVLLHVVRQKYASGKCFQLMAKTVQLLTYSGDKNDAVLEGMDIRSYKDHFLNTLCTLHWEPTVVQDITVAFKEIDLSPLQMTLAVKKIISQFSSVATSELPSLVYQLLLISRKGCKDVVLKGIFNFFSAGADDEQATEMRSPEDLRNAEGTIILHLIFAMKQDTALANDYLKMVKASKMNFVTPFHLSILLTMMQTFYYEAQAFELIKSMLSASYKTQILKSSTFWLPDAISSSALNIDAVFRSVCLNCTLGWDYTIQGIVKTCFALMDHSCSALTVKNFDLDSPWKPSNPQEMTLNLSIETLAACFKLHEISRTEIIEQLLPRLFTRSDSIFVPLLVYRKIVKDSSQELLEYVPQVSQMFDQICYLPFFVADNFMKTTLPFIFGEQHQINSLVVVLKKALFGRDAEPRKVALQGFVHLLGLSTRPVNFSTSTSCTFIPHSTQHKMALVSEIMGTLRRVLGQKCSLTKLLYVGLLELADSTDSFELLSQSFDLLYGRIVKFIQTEDLGQLPVLFGQCIKDGEVSEPFPLLLLALCKISNRLRTFERHDLSKLESFNVTVSKIQSRIMVADFDTLKTATDFSSKGTGQENFAMLDLVKGTFESFVSLSVSPAPLLDKILWLCPAKIDKKCKFVRSQSMRLEDCIRLFETVFATPILNDGQIDVAINLVKDALETFNESEEATLEGPLNICKLFKLFEARLSTTLNVIGLQIVGVVRMLMESMAKHWPARLSDLFRGGDLASDESVVDDSMLRFIAALKPLILNDLDSEDSAQLSNEIGRILKVIAAQSTHGESSIQVFDWIEELLQLDDMADAPFLLALISLASTVSPEHTVKMFVQMSLDIRNVLGSFERKDDGAAPTQAENRTFKSLTKKNSLQVVSVIMASCSENLAKMESLVVTSLMDEDLPVRKQGIEAVCVQLLKVVKIFVNLNISQILQASADILSNLTSTYRVLAIMIKTTTADSVSKRLVDVIAAASSDMTPSVYGLIAYIQTAERQKAAQHESKKKKGNKGAAVKSDKKSKLIPNLIYQIEQYERFLIALSKKSKINLTKYCKRSTSRDFRILVENLPDIEQDENNDEDQEEDPKLALKRKN